MCGICGFISRQEIDIDELNTMNNTMRHRGPDDQGAEIRPLKAGYRLGLAQRRLAVVDLSAAGHQPMHSPDGRISVIFNGEIYNYRELKKELTAYPFTSACDTEVIIAAYLKWGIDCVSRFNGMFAIALFDQKTAIFHLIRDRAGKKPLYYQFEDGNLYFASELKPIMKRPGFKKEIRKDILSRYLHQLCVCHPDSIFSGVYKLPPGALLTLDMGEATRLQAEVRKYWDIADVYRQKRENPVSDYAEARGELKELLKKAVTARMIADVPLGVFLSGGYDSSLMSAIAAEASSAPVKTFSIGFQEERYNEAKYAKAIAEYLGCNHTEAYISEADMFALVESIPAYFDEPFADSSQIPMMLVSELARRDVTVALSGDGGDEFFCGYNIYEAIRQAQMLDIPGGVLHSLLNAPLIRRLLLERRLPFRARIISANRDPETKAQFGGGSYAQIAEKMAAADSALNVRYPFESKYQVKNWQIRRMLLDMDTYLPADILTKVDRASMKYSLEARCPLLDQEVMEYSFRLDHSFKYEKGVKKRILKDIAYDYIPRELLDRPKTGFAVPLDKWLRGPFREQLTDMVNVNFLRNQGLFDADYTAATVLKYLQTGDGGPGTGANYSRLIWAFFAFQKWYECYM